MRNEVDLPEIRPNGTLIATIGTRDPHCSARASCPVTSSALPVEGLGTILHSSTQTYNHWCQRDMHIRHDA